jgi:hypothetical protein
VLTVQQVTLSPPDGRFKIVDAPAPGSKLGIYGSGDNPIDAPVALPICVRFEPTDTAQQPASVQVVVDAQGGSAQQVKAKVEAIWTTPSTYTLACKGPQRIDFGAGPPGGTLGCKLQNHGPDPLKIGALVLAPGNNGVGQADVDAAFAADIFQGGAQSPPWTVAVGGVAELRVHWKGSANPPPATLRVTLEQDSELESLDIPVLAGACDLPTLEVAPAPPTFLAAPGSSASSTLTVANQSCAPMTITQGCVTGYQVSQEEACETGSPSASFSVVAGQLEQTIAPWGMAELQLAFAPSSTLDKPHYGQLHLYLCRGLWDGKACSGKVTKVSVQLEGNTGPGITPPIAQMQPVVGAKVGMSSWLTAVVKPGSHPIGDQGAFQWWVLARPFGSTAWLGADVTDGAARRFTPDIAGTYTIALRVSAFTPGELKTQSNSQPTVVSFSAQ